MKTLFLIFALLAAPFLCPAAAVNQNWNAGIYQTSGNAITVTDTAISVPDTGYFLDVSLTASGVKAFDVWLSVPGWSDSPATFKISNIKTGAIPFFLNVSQTVVIENVAATEYICLSRTATAVTPTAHLLIKTRTKR